MNVQEDLRADGGSVKVGTAEIVFENYDSRKSGVRLLVLVMGANDGAFSYCTPTVEVLDCVSAVTQTVAFGDLKHHRIAVRVPVFGKLRITAVAVTEKGYETKNTKVRYSISPFGGV